jgi:hypothetical protein
VQTYAKYRDQGVRFVGLTFETDLQREQVVEFVERFGINWPVGLAADETLAALDVSGYPTLIVIGRDGRIVWRDHFAENGLEQAIEHALAAK